MPRSYGKGLGGESDERPELPGMVDRESLERDGTGNRSTMGRISGRVTSEMYTREALLDMLAERDVAPLLMGEEGDEGVIPLRKPGTGYFTICPDRGSRR